jgi:hypothetical protein
MDSINPVYTFLFGGWGFGYHAEDLFLLAATAWLFVFTPEMALGASVTSLNYSCIANNFTFLSLAGRFCVVVCDMPLE